MNFYKRYPGDYGRDTAHLSLAQHGAYTLLLDHIYSTEKPLEKDPAALFRICRAFASEEQEAVLAVVREFFIEGPDGYTHKRVEAEIAKASVAREAAQNNGKKGGRPSASSVPRETQQEPIENPLGSKKKPKAKPNQTPDSRHQTSDTVTRKVKTIVEPAALSTGKPSNDVLTVFDYWKQIMGHKQACLDVKREGAVKARIKDGYTVEQLMAAVDGCKMSPFHQGQNDNAMVYDDLELICRDSKRVDQFIAISGQPNMVGLSAAGRISARSAQAFLEEMEAENQHEEKVIFDVKGRM